MRPYPNDWVGGDKRGVLDSFGDGRVWVSDGSAFARPVRDAHVDISNILGERLTSEENGGRDVVQSDRVASILVLLGLLTLFFLGLVVVSYV